MPRPLPASPARRRPRAVSLPLVLAALPLLLAAPPLPAAAADAPAASPAPAGRPAEEAGDIGNPVTERWLAASGVGDLAPLYDPLEASRRLLLLLRDPLPTGEGEAAVRLHLARLRALAVIVDPDRLPRALERVEAALPVYLAWLGTPSKDAADALATYGSSGARAYAEEWADFSDLALLAVAGRVDSLLSALDRAARDAP